MIDKDLEDNYMVVGEGIQTRMKVLEENAYEVMKELPRNGKSNEDLKKDIKELIDSLEIEPTEKKYLNTISPFNYTGIYKL